MNFKPKISDEEIQFYLRPGQLEGIKIENNHIYNLVKKLTNYAFPEREEYGDLFWEDFYVPIKIYGKLRLLPLKIKKYKENFYLFFRFLTYMEVKRGNIETEKFFEVVLKETLKFLPILKNNPNIVKKLVPYKFRSGRIKAKHVMDNVMSKEEAENIKKNYEKLRSSNIKIEKISLDEYLEVAAVCYKAAFKEKTKGLSKVKMYKKWADGRDCGMLEIKDKRSKKEFENWLKTKAHCGGHPFEIVFSWTRHGILLYPPRPDRPYFTIGFMNYTYAEPYVEMVKALTRDKIPVEAMDLNDALELLTGEKQLSVNEYGEDFYTTIFYSHHPSERRLFKFIEWDDLKVVKFKNSRKK